MRRQNLGLWAEQKGRADLYARRAQHQCRHESAGIANATRSDHRNPHGIDDLRQQGEKTNLRCNVLGEEHPAMTASFNSLRDHRITATLLQVPSLPDCCRGRDYLCAGRFNAFDQADIREAVMEADHLGF